MGAQTVLISGAGIAGPTLAFWLAAAGFQTTIVERAPALRTGGYVVDFWGLGYDIAERMGLRPTSRRRATTSASFASSATTAKNSPDSAWRPFARWPEAASSPSRAAAFPGCCSTGPLSEPRSCSAIRLRRSTRSGRRHVAFERAPARRFDLVIGADGLHSNVRRLVFGPERSFETDLGYAIAAFEAEGYRPRDEDVYVLHNAPGAMIGRVALRDDRSCFSFIFTAEDGALPERYRSAEERSPREVSRRGRGNAPKSSTDSSGRQDLYFDRVSQIRMERWSQRAGSRSSATRRSAFPLRLDRVRRSR